MAESQSLADRYQSLVDDIVQMTLKGQIRSKEQVYQMLMKQVQSGTGEVFERVLGDRLTVVQRQTETQTDELKQAKAVRSLRALQTIQGEWTRWQDQNQAADLLSGILRQIKDSEPGDRLPLLLRVLDPNRSPALSFAQCQQLAKRLAQYAGPSPDGEQFHDLAQGLTLGLEDWQRLESVVVSWMYVQNQAQLGFDGVPGQRGPWPLWAKEVKSEFPTSLFQALALERSPQAWAMHYPHWGDGALLELAILLRGLQQGLVAWFDKLVYDSKVGAKLSISTFLGFAVIWSQIANGLNQRNVAPDLERSLADGCFQITLQILRNFAQRDYFPLYSGVFASFSGEYLRDALSYLDEPLQRAEGTQEKARILNLLGYSARALGQTERAMDFLQQSLHIAREAGDRPCEISSLNHISRTYVAQKNYTEAINTSQRALILSRQYGDRSGEANALTNLGYSEVFQAQQLEADPDTYERAIGYLQQGLQLSERLGDRQSQALCLSSLGIANVVLDQAQEAIPYLESGIQAAQFSGDLYLQGINLSYLAEAHHRLGDTANAITAASLAMYQLEQIGSGSWRQPAGLLTILQGTLGEEAFQALLSQQRSRIIPAIGVDGYDYLPQLLNQYRNE